MAWQPVQGRQPLAPFGHQVAGQSSMLWYDSTTVCKPLIARELFVYQTMPPQLQEFTPEFRGEISLELQETNGYIHLYGVPVRSQPLEPPSGEPRSPSSGQAPRSPLCPCSGQASPSPEPEEESVAEPGETTSALAGGVYPREATSEPGETKGFHPRETSPEKGAIRSVLSETGSSQGETSAERREIRTRAQSHEDGRRNSRCVIRVLRSGSYEVSSSLNEVFYTKGSQSPAPTDSQSPTPSDGRPFTQNLNPWSLKNHKRLLDKMRKSEHSLNSAHCILLKNVVAGLKHPCILDLKIGSRLHGDDASQKKVASQSRKCDVTTSSSLGLRLCGMQVYQADTGILKSHDKFYGRTLNDSSFKTTLREFLHDGRRFRCELLPLVIRRLSELIQCLQGLSSFRFYASSLLIIYAGEPAASGGTHAQSSGSTCVGGVHVSDDPGVEVSQAGTGPHTGHNVNGVSSRAPSKAGLGKSCESLDNSGKMSACGQGQISNIPKTDDKSKVASVCDPVACCSNREMPGPGSSVARQPPGLQRALHVVTTPSSGTIPVSRHSVREALTQADPPNSNNRDDSGPIVTDAQPISTTSFAKDQSSHLQDSTFICSRSLCSLRCEGRCKQVSSSPSPPSSPSTRVHPSVSLINGHAKSHPADQISVGSVSSTKNSPSALPCSTTHNGCTDEQLHNQTKPSASSHGLSLDCQTHKHSLVNTTDILDKCFTECEHCTQDDKPSQSSDKHSVQERGHKLSQSSDKHSVEERGHKPSQSSDKHSVEERGHKPSQSSDKHSLEERGCGQQVSSTCFPGSVEVDVRMIDFAHTTHSGFLGDKLQHSGPDLDYISGLKNLVELFTQLQQES